MSQIFLIGQTVKIETKFKINITLRIYVNFEYLTVLNSKFQKIRPVGRFILEKKMKTLVLLIAFLITLTKSNNVDPNGYVVFCPCMGKET